MLKVFFIDKDGTLVDNSNYPEIIPSDELLPNVLDGLRLINRKNFKIIIVSNQPWISKGRADREEIERIFSSLINQLKKEEVIIHDYIYCPHKSLDNCNCKKPKTGMFEEMAKKHNIDVSSSYMVGDMDVDILAGKRIGAKTVLVRTGRGKDFENIGADFVIDNLNKIGEVI
jgi:D-glycero-D-manno-heptose 1,7-bisphosphate phosphatase